MKYIKRRNALSSLSLFALSLACIGALGAATAHAAWNFTVPAIEVQPQNNMFVFDTSPFADGKARHFVYKHSSSEWVRFFLVKSGDGIIRAAFDACDVCWQHKKGYVQQGNFLVCINCGLKFRTDKVNEVKGGCNPSPLRRTVQGNKLIISVQDALSGLKFFQ